MGRYSDIRQALSDALGAIPELQTSRFMRSNPDPPAAYVYPAVIEYDKAFRRGLDDWTFTVQVFVGFVDDDAAQMQLDEYLEPAGPRSVKQALEAFDYGELCDSVRVVRAEGYRPYKRDDGGLLLGSEWTVSVRAPGK